MCQRLRDLITCRKLCLLIYPWQDTLGESYIKERLEIVYIQRKYFPIMLHKMQKVLLVMEDYE